MRRITVLLPALLVVFLSGQTKAEASEVEAVQAANVLPLKDEVESREVRETDKQTRRARRKNARKEMKEGTNPDPKSKKAKKKKKSKAKNGKDDKQKRKNRKDTKKKKKKKGKKGKGERKKKNKNKTKGTGLRGNKGGRQSPPAGAAGGDWSSCGETGVNDTCLINVVNALSFEKNQIQNFFKQKARFENQGKTTKNKLGKKGEFEDAAKYMLQAIGGDINNVTCGENTTRSSRAAKSAGDTYNLLNNCSATIKEACSIPNNTVNTTFNAECATVYTLSKRAADDCRTNNAYTTNGSAACNCWEKAAIGITIAKDKGCTKAGKKQAQAVKANKTKCLKAFGVCKKAEDAAIALIHTCMSGEVNTNASSSEKLTVGF